MNYAPNGKHYLSTLSLKNHVLISVVFHSVLHKNFWWDIYEEIVITVVSLLEAYISTKDRRWTLNSIQK